MRIEIHMPELEALIHERMRSGAFEDIEDIRMQALQSAPFASVPPVPPAHQFGQPKTLRKVFASVAGMAEALDLSRHPSIGRQVEVS